MTSLIKIPQYKLINIFQNKITFNTFHLPNNLIKFFQIIEEVFLLCKEFMILIFLLKNILQTKNQIIIPSLQNVLIAMTVWSKMDSTEDMWLLLRVHISSISGDTAVKHCGLTISILPSFLLPHFQRSLRFIFNSIKEYLFNKKFLLYKRAVFLYFQRFKSNIPGIISFFRDTIGRKISFGKRKTIKLIEMIKDSPVSTFSSGFITTSIQVLWHFNFTTEVVVFKVFLKTELFALWTFFKKTYKINHQISKRFYKKTF